MTISPVFPIGYSPPHAVHKKPPIIGVVDHEMEACLKRIFAAHGSSMSVSILPVKSNCWIRDAAVFCKGEYIVPKRMGEAEKKRCFRGVATCMSPLAFKLHMMKQNVIGGCGMTDLAISNIVPELSRLDKSVRYSPFCVEGGNCFIVQNDTDTSLAIIGENSVWLSYFGERKFTTTPTGDVSKEFVRSMRNLSWLVEKGKIEETMLDEVSAEDVRRYGSQAGMLQARFEEVLEGIKKDLKVDSVLHLIQKGFHIDMQMFVDAHRKIAYTSSTSMARKVLEKHLTSVSWILPYWESACAVEGIHTEIEQENKRRLQNAGFRVVEVPGELFTLDDFHPGYEYCRVNFVNGFFTPDGAWVTSDVLGDDYNFIKEAFLAEYKAATKGEALVLFADGELLYPKLLGKGGLRCCTQEMAE